MASFFFFLCFLSLFLSFFVPVFLSFFVCSCLSFFLCSCLSFFLSLFLSFFLSLFLSFFLSFFVPVFLSLLLVPAASPSRGGDVVVYVRDTNQLSLLTPFHSVLVFISVLKALLTVFLSMNSPDNSPLSHSVLSVSILPYWSFKLCISLYESLRQP